MNHFQGLGNRTPLPLPEAKAELSCNTSKTSMQGSFMKNPQRKRLCLSAMTVLMLLAAGSATAGVSWSIGISSPNVVVAPRPPAVVYEAAPAYVIPAPVYPVAPRVVVAPPVVYQPPSVALRIDHEHDPYPYYHHRHDDDCDDD
ncbi:hypothetical protein J2W23_001322 [Variovorax boronicumulans]|uniref:hypothetical protein n=1 Tax=Variovorax boronicumulans TaxID=436515 RepID=UPI00278B11F1|nr:hypothetical protein [Variovorax boronicumulans]MDQ0012943.1 hypothetical protein [Variovorax boronicumulans]